MALQTLLPASTLSNSGAIIGGSATVNAALADANDATGVRYESAGGIESSLLRFPSPTVNTGQRVARYRSSIRTRRGVTGIVLGPDAQVRVQAETSQLPPAQFGQSTTWTPPTSIEARTTGWFTDLIQPTSGNFRGPPEMRLYGLQLDDSTGGEFVEVLRAELHVDVWDRYSGHTVAALGTVTNDDQPPVTFDFGTPNYGTPGTTRVSLTLVSTSPDPDEVLIFDQTFYTGSPTGTVTRDLIAEQGIRLANGDYTWLLQIVKEDVAGADLPSLVFQRPFTVNVVPPAAAALDVVVDQAAGRQTLTVTPAAATYDTLEQVEVQRSTDGGTTWRTVRGGVLTDAAFGAPSVVHDWDAPRDVPVRYRARTVEGATAPGTTFASAWTPTADVVHPSDGRTWIYDVDAWEHAGPVHRLASAGVSRSHGEQAGVFDDIVGRDTAVVISSGPRARRHPFELIGVGNDQTARAEALLTGWRPNLLVKHPDGRQDYLRAIGDVTEIELDDDGGGITRVWSFTAVDVADGY